MKNSKILVPIDFEQQSLINLQWAKFFSQFSSSQLILTHILEENNFLKKLFLESEFEKKFETKALEELKRVAKEALGENIDKIIFTIEKGKPYEAIEDLADEFDPFMIIIGKNESNTKGKKYLGSNTLHIISETDYPVVSIYGNHKPEDAQNVIFLPLDLNKSVSEQLSATIEYAKFFDSKVKALSVLRENSISAKSQILVKLNKIKEKFEQNNIPIETEIIESNGPNTEIAEIINQQAEKLKPILVVTMLRDENNFKDFFIGSVAKEIILKCNAPVLTIKPWDAEHEENPIFKMIVNPFDIF